MSRPISHSFRFKYFLLFLLLFLDSTSGARLEGNIPLTDFLSSFHLKFLTKFRRFFYPFSPPNSSSRPTRQCQVLSVSFASSISRHRYSSSKLSPEETSLSCQIFTRIIGSIHRIAIGSAWHRIHHFVTKFPRSIYSLDRSVSKEARLIIIPSSIDRWFHFYFSKTSSQAK